jgi:DNA topoisomerase VI subunit A
MRDYLLSIDKKCNALLMKGQGQADARSTHRILKKEGKRKRGKK